MTSLFYSLMRQALAAWRHEGQPPLWFTIALAAIKHANQKDKQGEPYILHPLRVMLKQVSYGARTVALLHDTMEDCGVTSDELRSWGYDEGTIHRVRTLTKRPGEDYQDFISRIIATNGPVLFAVKLADIEDNRDPLRQLQPPGPDDLARLERYALAHQRLTAAKSALTD